MKITLPRQTLIDIMDEDVDIVRNKLVDHSRWSLLYEFIFKFKTEDGVDRFFRTFYSVGATESQDESPWEYEDQVECTEVEAYEKTVIDYKSVR